MTERIVYETEYDNTKIQVIDNPRTRHLRFGNTVKQSSMLIDYPDALALKYIRTMVQGLVLNPNSKSILFLGLGAGSLVKYINKYFDIPRVDVVELLPDVVGISKKHFGLHESDKINITIDTAINYLKANESKYDIVFVDIFNASGMSEEGKTDEFYSLLTDSLNFDGWVVWNTWIRETTYDMQVSQWKKFFDVVFVRPPVPKSGNVVMFGGKNNPLKNEELDIRIKDIQSRVPNMGLKKDIIFNKNFKEL